MFGNIRRAGATGAFYLDKPLKGENIFSAADATGADSKKDDSRANALFSLFGGKNAVKTQALEVSTTDEQYRAAFGALLDTTAEAMVGALKGAR